MLSAVVQSPADCHPSAAPSINPGTVVHALNVPTFYQQEGQFWHMMRYLFQLYNQKPVWQHLPVVSHYHLAKQLHLAVDSFESEAEMIPRRELFFQAYFAIVSKTRGEHTQTEWLAHSPQDFLTSMHKMYRLLFSMRGSIPPLPNFGHVHSSLKK